MQLSEVAAAAVQWLTITVQKGVQFPSKKKQCENVIKTPQLCTPLNTVV